MNQQRKTRDFIADWRNWDNLDSLDKLAAIHKKETFFAVSGKYDTFDNIRVALWQHRQKKSTIVTGTLFRNEWFSSKSGIIPMGYGSDGVPHAFKIFGQKVIDGKLYLVAQLSQGVEYGDNGLFYFPREVVNKEIGKYGIFMFKDISREEAEKILKGNKSWLWSLITKIFKI